MLSLTNLAYGSAYELLPPNFKSDPEIKSFCFTMEKLCQEFYERSKSALIWSNIGSASEEVVDYLAAELRTPFYSADLALETKRMMVSNTLNWYSKLGTKEVVEDIIKLTFGTGEVQEWFDTGSEPFTFRIETGALLAKTELESFMYFLNLVKNARSHLEKLTVLHESTKPMYIGVAMEQFINIEIKPNTEPQAHINIPISTGTVPSIYSHMSMKRGVTGN